MLDGLIEEINDFIKDEGRDLKYKVSDKLQPINFDSTPSISYDYLLLEPGHPYSFLNSEINQLTSEEFPDLSDAQIYFEKIKKICKTDFGDLTDDTIFFKIIKPNPELKKVADFIFSERLKND